MTDGRNATIFKIDFQGCTHSVESIQLNTTKYRDCQQWIVINQALWIGDIEFFLGHEKKVSVSKTLQIYFIGHICQTF